MAASLRKGFCVSCSGAPALDKKRAMAAGAASSLELPPRNGEFKGGQLVFRDAQAGRDTWAAGDRADLSVHAQASSICVPRSMRWWEKGVMPNMVEIGSAQELVDSLLNAGDRLVVVDFYSPGCGGCKSLHPKICQFAETNPDAQFLKVNYEEHKSLCYSLNVHVLPFFRFYRGSQGRVCSFSCTNATIKKFKDALAKHGAERRSLGPAKGLQESELLKLASNRDLHFKYPLVSPGIDGLAANYAGGLVEEEMAALAM
uniref:Thioredoxin-like 1-1, chloroplastic n=1 Tax=Anthurium amnicola TaxID=1678845 RepID=A0A1D1ZKW2_9ARAE